MDKYSGYQTLLKVESVLKNILSSFELTTRETEVLYLWIFDLNHKDIAKRLYISDSTVRKHIQNIYAKLQINSKAQIMIIVFVEVFKESG